MELTKVNCPTNKYSIKCPYEMAPEFIIVHNTANDASAMAEISYMLGNGNTTSFHYAIDDYRIVQGIEENRNTWNCGDGTNGNGNRKGISIEICYSKSGGDNFTNAEMLASKFIAMKLNGKGWGIDKVKKHQDFNGKYCPHRTLDLKWQRFLDMISAEMGQVIEELGVEEVEQLRNEVQALRNEVAELRNLIKGTNTVVNTRKSIDEIAREVIAGKWGNGVDRKTRLANAGYNPTEVQNRVNQILK